MSILFVAKCAAKILKIGRRTKKIWSQTFLNRDFLNKNLIEGGSREGGKYFPANFLKTYCFIIIVQNHYKMKQMTYLRPNLYDQVKIFGKKKKKKKAFSRTSIISLARGVIRGKILDFSIFRRMIIFCTPGHTCVPSPSCHFVLVAF